MGEVIRRKVSTKTVKHETPKKEKKENKKDLVDSEDDFDLTTNDTPVDAGDESEDSKDLVEEKEVNKDTPEVNGKESNKKGLKNEVLATSSDEEKVETPSKKKGKPAS